MKVLHLSTSDLEGGAARAAWRLHQGLRSSGVDSHMLVQQKRSASASVHPRYAGSGGPTPSLRDLVNAMRVMLVPHLDRAARRFYPGRELSPWSVGWLPGGVKRRVTRLAPDLVHLHWVGDGFVSINALATLQWPLVWTLHDMWAFTGGCHYAFECERYCESCGACPQLNSTRQNDLSRWTLRRKRRAWHNLNLTIVTPSRWLAECAAASSILKGARIEVIPNGLELDIYRPVDKSFARKLFGLPSDKQLVLFGAVFSTSSSRKGFQYVQEASKMLAGQGGRRDAVDLVVFGASEPANPPDLGFKIHYMGHLHDDLSLVALYSAADVFVAPSVQDNLPNTVMEALACGVPCVAFDIGGMPDMIVHQKNGFLARPFSSGELAEGITWVLGDEVRWQDLSRAARQKVEQEFGLEYIAQRYNDLYCELL